MSAEWIRDATRTASQNEDQSPLRRPRKSSCRPRPRRCRLPASSLASGTRTHPGCRSCATGAAAGGGGGRATGSRSSSAPCARTPTGSPSTPSYWQQANGEMRAHAVGAQPAQDRRPARRPRRGLLPARDASSSRRGSTRRRTTGVIVACANGLLDVDDAHAARRTTRGSSTRPRCRSPTTPTPREPMRWLAFLDELWPDDPDSIAALQEWFGYVISGRLDLQKILLLVGPTRGGKGAIARVLGALVGRENVAGPTLSSLGGDFGLAPLLGKPLAVISDARLDGRSSPRRRRAAAGDLRRGHDHRQPQVPRPVDRQAAVPVHGHLQRAAALRRRLGGDRRPVRRAAAHPLVARQGGPRRSSRRCTPSCRGSSPGRSTASSGCREQGRFTRPASTDEAIIALRTSPRRSPRSSATAARPGAEARGRGATSCRPRGRSWAEDNGHAAARSRCSAATSARRCRGCASPAPRRRRARSRLHRRRVRGAGA